MTKEEVLKHIQAMKLMLLGNDNQPISDAFYALEMAEEALEQSRWIPTAERLPEERINPITEDFYEYQCTYQGYGVEDVRHYKFGRGHWWHGSGIMDDCVTAWRENPEPYKAESED